ncbi:unnamed protein product [Oppiella nova]|uniref:(S)-2-hydroxy-acid oxidase n=1 Tax=Oppiella nova TaxID=334625 RepID=A0A7R9QV25_9ACAR|nr:unnamed protein product [Oppiella nova]CAG2175421.1 unnamed protein product [Oppiella nova]
MPFYSKCLHTYLLSQIFLYLGYLCQGNLIIPDNMISNLPDRAPHLRLTREITVGKDNIYSLRDIESAANEKLDAGLRDYLNRGAQNEITLGANREVFNRYRIIPRYMVDVSKRNLTVQLFGETLPAPIGVSPFGRRHLFYKDGDYEVAIGAAKFGTVVGVSSGSSVTIEELAEREPNAMKWFQIFIFSDRNMTKDMAQRAERAGYKALVLTVDHNSGGIRYHDTKSVKVNNSDRANYRPYTGANKGIANDVTWDDVKWLKRQVQIPVVIKGVLTAGDARLAVNSGADAIFVSNHGGRQIDGVPATLEALPEIVSEVGREVDVYLDGGVRNGNDIFKALALGAKVVFVGRPAAWGLVYNGSEGVNTVLDILYKELDNVMAIAGTPTIRSISRSRVRSADDYRKGV